MKRMLVPTNILIILLTVHSVNAQTLSKEQKIKIALSAGPQSVTEKATVMEWDTREVLRQGTNDYFCFPSLPGGIPYPMCINEQWIKWFEAYIAGENPPPVTKVAVGYWLQGVPPMSNEDPYATPEEAKNHVIAPGEPHAAIIFPDTDVLEGLPTHPDQGGPWVMFKGTPFVHLMVPAPSPVMNNESAEKH